MRGKINRLIETSKKVLLDCCLENGAIVAANTTKEYYSPEVKNYFYVWPRDAVFICLAADVLELKEIQDKFFNWLMKRAEGWAKSSLFYQKYYPNGLKNLQETSLQIDQTGIVLFALWHHFKDKKKELKKYKDLIISTANAICNLWQKNHFTSVIQDLWEERYCFSDLEENFSYSLGSCFCGLIAANELFPNQKFIKIANQMKKVLLKSAEEKGYFSRSFGKINDLRIDASLLGLIWPFEIVKPKDKLALKTVNLIEKKLVKDLEVYRYEHDEYDGWMFESYHRKKGAGYWPILNFWLSIVLNKMGKKKKAIQYYQKVVDGVDEHIPEQIFNNKIQKSISPLAWSHAMFILATKELGFLK